MILHLLTSIICLVFTDRAPNHDKATATLMRENLVNIARAEIGVRELSGKNNGKRVEQYLSAAKLQRGQPWCAAFISWIFKQAGHSQPRTGWSPALFNNRVNTKEILPGNVFGLWLPSFKRIAHVGLIEKKEGDWIWSIEGNTNIGGSREGDGVYRRRRHSKTISTYADWLPKERRQL